MVNREGFEPSLAFLLQIKSLSPSSARAPVLMFSVKSCFSRFRFALFVLVCAPALRNNAAATNTFLSLGTLGRFRFTFLLLEFDSHFTVAPLFQHEHVIFPHAILTMHTVQVAYVSSMYHRFTLFHFRTLPLQFLCPQNLDRIYWQ